MKLLLDSAVGVRDRYSVEVDDHGGISEIAKQDQSY